MSDRKTVILVSAGMMAAAASILAERDSEAVVLGRPGPAPDELKRLEPIKEVSAEPMREKRSSNRKINRKSGWYGR